MNESWGSKMTFLVSKSIAIAKMFGLGYLFFVRSTPYRLFKAEIQLIYIQFYSIKLS